MLKVFFGLKLISIASLLTTILLACEVGIEKTAEPKSETSQTNINIPTEETLAILHVDSSALPEGVYLPHKYTCKDIGNVNDEFNKDMSKGYNLKNTEQKITDVSPPLQWSNVPQGTKSFAVILDDPDAIGGSFIHWVFYNIPPDTTSLEENLPRTETLPDGSMQGTNDFGNLGYNGPCPLSAFGKIHNWVFSVYALDVEVNLPPGVTYTELMNVISKHILARGILIRKYRAPSTSYGKYIPQKEYLSLPYSI